jgi:membrane-associated protease RseP (regulator of RpoE activity)
MNKGILRLLAAALIWTLPMAAAASPVAAGPSIDSIRDWYQREVRAASITWRILAANAATCAVTRRDYGMHVVSPNEAAPAPVQESWRKALGLGVGASVTAVMDNGPAAAKGIKTGDAIVAAGDVRWTTDPASHPAFRAALAKAAQAAQIKLTIVRDNAEQTVTLDARKICDVGIVLVRNGKFNATARDTTVFLDNGTERLLTSDDELASIIAHEVAHIILDHVKPENRQAVKDHAVRGGMEQAADAMSVRLILRAGYAPEAAADASPKLARANRGPIARMLDIHGPYMETGKRAAFLLTEASKARAEIQ